MNWLQKLSQQKLLFIVRGPSGSGKSRMTEGISEQHNAPVFSRDNTNTTFSEMKPYVQMAQKYGYSVTFKEPDWDPRLKTPEGQWNINFLEEMQNQPDREKIVPREVLESMVGGYEYNPTVENVLSSERPRRPD